MNQKPKFDVLYSEAVLNFLKSLDPKASNKYSSISINAVMF